MKVQVTKTLIRYYVVFVSLHLFALNRYYMAVRRYDIFLRVLKNISLYAMTLKMLCAYRLCDIYLCS